MADLDLSKRLLDAKLLQLESLHLIAITRRVDDATGRTDSNLYTLLEPPRAPASPENSEAAHDTSETDERTTCPSSSSPLMCSPLGARGAPSPLHVVHPPPAPGAPPPACGAPPPACGAPSPDVETTDGKRPAADVWHTVRQALQLQVSRSTYHAYIAPSTYAGNDADAWTISAPSNSAADLLNLRYHKLINQQLSATLGRPAKAHFLPPNLTGGAA